MSGEKASVTIEYRDPSADGSDGDPSDNATLAEDCNGLPKLDYPTSTAKEGETVKFTLRHGSVAILSTSTIKVSGVAVPGAAARNESPTAVSETVRFYSSSREGIKGFISNLTMALAVGPIEYANLSEGQIFASSGQNITGSMLRFGHGCIGMRTGEPITGEVALTYDRGTAYREYSWVVPFNNGVPKTYIFDVEGAGVWIESFSVSTSDLDSDSASDPYYDGSAYPKDVSLLIVDKDTQVPIAGAEIYLTAPTGEEYLAGSTDSEGILELTGYAQGTYSLRTFHEDFAETTGSFQVVN